MEYIKITHIDAVIEDSLECVKGIPASKETWKEHGFTPKIGYVAAVEKTISAFPVDIIIAEIGQKVYVPIKINGVEEITYSEYMSKKSIQGKFDNGLERLIDNRTLFADCRDLYKKDILQNIKELTCDWKRDIFMPDLEESCVMYASIIILNYKMHVGNRFNEKDFNFICEQIIDVYSEQFKEFFFENRQECFRRIRNLSSRTNARQIVESYYQRVIERYGNS